MIRLDAYKDVGAGWFYDADLSSYYVGKREETEIDLDR